MVETTKTKNQTSKAKTISKKVKDEILYMMEMYKHIFMQEDSSTFHDLLIAFKNNPSDLQEDEQAFVNQFVSYFKTKNLSIDSMLQNKDLFMSRELKQNEGSFFTPLRWARQAHKLVVDTVGLENLKDYNVWDSSCGSGNLLIEFPECKHLFFSTLNPEDIPIVKERVSKVRPADSFTAFDLDFLSEIDGIFSKGFTSLLPDNLQKALLNNEKFAIILNPPYSTRGTDTYVGRELVRLGLTDFKTDLYRQFVWQVCNLVKAHNLTNVEFVLMVAGSINVSKRAQSTIELLDNTFNYRGGFVYPAREFEGVSDGFEWGISTTHWGIQDGEPKKHVTYLEMDTYTTTDEQVDVFDYDGSFLRKDRRIIDTGKTEYSVEVQPSMDVWSQGDIPSDRDTTYVKISSYGDEVITDDIILASKLDKVLFFLYARDTLRDCPRYITFQTTPLNTGDIEVREDNLDRAIFYMAYGMKVKDWSERSYQRFIPPVDDDYYRNVYLPNAYLIAFMTRKNMTYATRELKTRDGLVSYNNPTFFLTEDEIKSSIKHAKVQEDFEKHYKPNTFILNKIKWAYDNADEVIKQAWDIYKGIHIKYLENRLPIEGQPLTSAYDLNFSQIRRLENFDKKDEEAYVESFEKALSKMKEINQGLTFDYGGHYASN